MEPRRLGHGCEGVEAIELVTSEGKLIRASKTENHEYFWAARGAGSGFSASSRATISSCKPFPRRCMGAAIFIPSRKPPPSRVAGADRRESRDQRRAPFAQFAGEPD